VNVARYATHGANGWPSNGSTNDASQANGICTSSSSNANEIISLQTFRLLQGYIISVH